MILNTANLTTLFQAYNAAFKGAFTSATSEWRQIATEVPSAGTSNLYAWLGQFPKMRQWVGDRHIKNMAMHNYTLTNQTFETTVSVSADMIADDSYGSMTPLMAEMGHVAAVHPDEQVFGILAAGNSTVCYDGQYFFDTDHPVIVNGAASTKANFTSGASNLWCLLDTRRPLKPFIFQKREDYTFSMLNQQNDEPVFMRNEYVFGVKGRVVPGYGIWQCAYGATATLNQSNVESYIAAMMGFKSDEDRPLGINPNILVCGPSNMAAAYTTILSEKLASGASNPLYNRVKVIVSPYLT